MGLSASMFLTSCSKENLSVQEENQKEVFLRVESVSQDSVLTYSETIVVKL
jgi:hypothetical protein